MPVRHRRRYWLLLKQNFRIRGNFENNRSCVAGLNSPSPLADTMKNFLAKQSRKDLIILAKSFYRRYDKQFSRNSASLFICRVLYLWVQNFALLYVCAFRHTLEKTFFAN